MAENKTRPNDESVAKFIAAIPDAQRREDCRAIAALMQKVTGEAPRLWGSNIVGFGQYHYVYDSGREGDMLLVGFSPRKANLTLYITGGFDDIAPLLEKLGKHKTGGGCLYIKKLEDVHQPTLKKIIEQSVKAGKKKDRV